MTVSMFRYCLALAAGGAAAVAAASALVVLAIPVPMIVPINTLEIGRLLREEPISGHRAPVRVSIAARPGLAPAPADAMADALRAAIARSAGLPPDRIRFAFSTTRSLFEARGLASVRAEYGRNLLESRRLYGEDPRFSGLVIGPFRAAALQPDGRWRVVESGAVAPGPRWQLEVVKMIGLATLPIFVLAWMVSRAISGPVRRLARTADQIGRGGAQWVRPEGPLEVRQAADALNAMQARLDHQIRQRSGAVAAIAHDLRTPLARLAFLTHQLPEPTRARAEAQTREMERMIASALDYVQSEIATPQKDLVDLRSLLEGLIDDAADMGRCAELVAGESATIEGDALLLRRMFGNLIDNAITYGRVARARLLSSPDFAIVEIEDDGPGMTPEDLSRAFEPFFRAEPSRNADTGGAGLGLSIVRSVARAHGGDVALSSPLGGGLRAVVRLPMAPVSP